MLYLAKLILHMKFSKHIQNNPNNKKHMNQL